MTANTTTATFLEHLRSQTNDSHKKLESLPVSASILSEHLTPAAYAHYLRLMRDVVFETEHTVFPKIASVVPDLAQRRKSVMIQNDLETLGDTMQETRTVFTNAGNSVAFALGMMYTVEGSSLGGRVILKNINRVLGYDENCGAQYFAGYGNQTGSHWKNFLHTLTQYEQQSGSGEEIIAGAQYAFDAIHDHFAKNQ